MIGFPMGLDQATNAAIMEDKGYGLSLDILTFSVDELEDKIKTVGFTGHYRENIEQAINNYKYVCIITLFILLFPLNVLFYNIYSIFYMLSLQHIVLYST
jgi:hypothetical protein